MGKQEHALAYAAGTAAMTEPPERRTPDACPFPVGSDERAEWLRGLSDALDAEPDRPTLRKELDDALDLADSTS